MLRLVACVLACACDSPLPPSPPARAEELPELPARAPVAGRHGFHARSRVRYAAKPDLPHLLEVDYQFPARARWRMSSEGPGGRVVEYRAGQRGYRILPGSGASLVVEGADLSALVARMELRRAAFFWPDGLAWEPAESGAPPTESGVRLRATLRDELDPARAWGTLEARLPASEAGARPREFVLLDAAGRDGEKLVVQGWFEADGRSWPQRLEFVSGGRTVWTEEVLEVTGNAFFLDLSFVPPDRRPGATSGGPGSEQEPFLAVDLVPHLGRRHALPARAEWQEALDAALDLARQAERELGQPVDPAATLELDSKGQPVACWIRLAGAPPSERPAGWEAVAERPGLLAPLAAPQEAAARLRVLLEHVPSGTRAAAPYLRAYPREGGAPGAALADRRWELVLPLERGS